MKDNLSLVITILVLVLLLIIFPLYNNFQRQDNMSTNVVLKATTMFVDDVLNSGYIDQKMYDDFVTELANTGIVYDIELEAHKKVFTNALNSNDTKIEQFVIDYNNDILKDLDVASSNLNAKSLKNDVYRFNEGDKFYVRVKNSNMTMAGAIFSAILPSSSKTRISANYGGIVKNVAWKKVDATYIGHNIGPSVPEISFQNKNETAIVLKNGSSIKVLEDSFFKAHATSYGVNSNEIGVLKYSWTITNLSNNVNCKFDTNPYDIKADKTKYKNIFKVGSYEIKVIVEDKAGKTEENTVKINVTDVIKEGIYKDTNGKEAPIPKGFVVSTIPGEDTIDGGLVIKDGADGAALDRNEYVWVPVLDIDTMYDKATNRGKLYTFIPGRKSEVRDGCLTNNSGHIELGYSFTFDADGKKNGTVPIPEHLEMVESIDEYKGFYIGRYETSRDTNNRQNYLYETKRLKGDINRMRLDKNGVRESVCTDYAQSSLLWGSQWDATLNWLNTYDDVGDYVTNSYNQGNYNSSDFYFKNIKGELEHKIQKNDICIPTGSYEGSKVKNIYDMAGNQSEYTLETNKDGGWYIVNYLRGGSYRDAPDTRFNFSASGEAEGDPGNSEQPYHVGLRMCIHLRVLPKDITTSQAPEKGILYTDAKGNSAPIPNGFVVSSLDDEDKIDIGLVIKEGNESEATNRNEFVWIPVPDISKMYDSASQRGKLYFRKSYEDNELILNNDSLISSNFKREPDILTSYDDDINNLLKADPTGNLKTKEQFKLQLENEFSEMIESVKKYRGFYIARYESGNMSKTQLVSQKYNTDLGKSNWYDIYYKSKKMIDNDSVKTSMIWGSQWDATLEWFNKFQSTKTAERKRECIL